MPRPPQLFLLRSAHFPLLFFLLLSTGIASAGSQAVVSVYRPGFRGYTASGELYRPETLSAAHPSLAFGSLLEIARLDGRARVVVRINDRTGERERGVRISREAGRRLGIAPGESLAAIVAPMIKVERVKRTPAPPGDSSKLLAVSAQTAGTSRTEIEGPWRIQLAAYRHLARLEADQHELKREGMSTLILKGARPEDAPFRLVTQTIFHEREAADRWLQALKTTGDGRFDEAFPVR